MRLVEVDREIKAASVKELKTPISRRLKRDRRMIVVILARIVIVNTAARLNHRHSIRRITKINTQTFSKVIVTTTTRRKLISILIIII